MARLGDVCDVRDGTHDSPSYVEEGYPLVTSKNIIDGKLDLSVVSYISFEDYRKINERSKVDSGDIIMPMIGTIGNPYIVEEFTDFAIKNVALIKFTNKRVFNKYIFYFLNSGKFRRYIYENNRGGTQKFLSLKDIRNIEIEFPTLDKQVEIVTKLNKVSNLICLRQQQLAKLDELVKARFVEMFGNQETNPFGWEKCTVGECCTLKSGTSLSAEVENEGGSIPYVKVGDMNYPGNERYITTSSRYVSEKTAGNGLFEVGSILFPKRGGAIGTNKKRMTKLPICADLNVMGVTSKGKLIPEYLFAYFDSIDLGALSDGSSVPQINNKNIAPLEICLPPMELQKQFTTFVEQVDKSKVAVQKALDEAQTLFDSLMQQYFG